MGNTASNASGPDSPTKKETSGDNKSPKKRSPNRTSKPAPEPSRNSLDKERVEDALRQQGLYVPESAMGDILRHKSPLDAVTAAITSGTARKLVKGQDPRTTTTTKKKNPQENVRPPLPPSSSSTSSRKISQKRSRTAAAEEEESTEMSSSTAVAATSTAGPPRGERPLKRPATMRGFASFAGGGGFGVFTGGGGDGTGDAPDNKLCSFKGIGAGGREKGADNESTESEERTESTAMTVDTDSQHVLLPMQQGSPPRQRLGRSRGVTSTKGSERKSSSHGVTREGLRGRTFVTVRAGVTTRKIEETIMAGLARWGDKSEEQKKETVRLVIKDLHLVYLGPERKERMDEDLARCVTTAMEQLVEMPNAQSGAHLISCRVHDTREMIHEVYSNAEKEYNDLVDKTRKQHDRIRTKKNSNHNNNRSSSTYSNSGPHRKIKIDEKTLAREAIPLNRGSPHGAPSQQAQRSNRFDPQSPTPPRRPQQQQADEPNSNSFGSLSFGLGSGPGASPFWGSSSGRGKGSVGGRGGGANLFWGSPREGNDGGGGGGGGGGSGGGSRVSRAESSPSPSAGGRSTAEQQPLSDEEKGFWQSLDLCYTALDDTAFVRREEEWLQRQLEVVTQQKEEVEEDDSNTREEHQREVETAEDSLKDAEDTVETATMAIIAEHVGAETKDQALRSLIDRVQTACGRLEGYELLSNRGRAKLTEESSKASLKTKRTRLVHVMHATAITAALCEHMFGDLLETAEIMLKRAHENRLSKQQLLKSNAKAVLDHLTKALGYHMTRRMSADEDVRQSAEKYEHNAKFFGEDSTKAQKSKETLDEMQAYVNDSIRKTDDIIKKIKLLVSKMGPELPEADCYTLAKDARQFFLEKKAAVRKEAHGRNIDLGGPMLMLQAAEEAFSPTSSRGSHP